uniref:Uncharacterized protein n=1 Tax=Acrobeloides nanus TaxID=290746 RepID=A0A914EAF9_9BILA
MKYLIVLALLLCLLAFSLAEQMVDQNEMSRAKRYGYYGGWGRGYGGYGMGGYGMGGYGMGGYGMGGYGMGGYGWGR